MHLVLIRKCQHANRLNKDGEMHANNDNANISMQALPSRALLASHHIILNYGVKQ